MLNRSGELQSIWLAKVSHAFSAHVWGSCDKVRHYFSLNKENELLAEENYRLSEIVRQYQSHQDAVPALSLPDSLDVRSDFSFIPSTIIKLSRNKQHNYFILNKGYEDGVVPQSGVITSSGIVGIIDAVERHYSYGISLMNSTVSISARLGRGGAVGPLSWDGMTRNGAVLKEIPLQSRFAQGDTVWTSGFSSIFPADIPLGITGDSKVVNGAVNEITVSLFQDFTALKYVSIVVNEGREEILYLENIEDQEEKQP